MIPRAASCVIFSLCFLIFADANFVPNIEELNCCEQRGRIKEIRTLFVLEIISNTSNQVCVKKKTAKKFIKKKKTSKQMFHVRRYHVSFFAFHLFLVEFHRNVKIKSGLRHNCCACVSNSNIEIRIAGSSGCPQLISKSVCQPWRKLR